MKKYTVIYFEPQWSGSQRYNVTSMRRVSTRGESVDDMLRREGLYDQMIYVFEGWPKLEGEVSPLGQSDEASAYCAYA